MRSGADTGTDARTGFAAGTCTEQAEADADEMAVAAVQKKVEEGSTTETTTTASATVSVMDANAKENAKPGTKTDARIDAKCTRFCACGLYLVVFTRFLQLICFSTVLEHKHNANDMLTFIRSMLNATLSGMIRHMRNHRCLSHARGYGHYSDNRHANVLSHGQGHGMRVASLWSA
jgi:hypothetical protein